MASINTVNFVYYFCSFHCIM